MANAFLGNMFVIDTAGPTLLKETLAPQLPTVVKVCGIRWSNVLADADRVEIQDIQSRPIYEDIRQGGIPPDESTIQWHISGDFKVTTLASGRLYIYIAA